MLRQTKKSFFSTCCYWRWDRFMVGADWHISRSLWDVDIFLGFLMFGFFYMKKPDLPQRKRRRKK